MVAEAVTLIERMSGREPLQTLRPTDVWDPELDRRIAALPDESPSGSAGRDVWAILLKAGLHLWNNSLDKSHRLAQTVENETGSYWHGIMHRLEGDYGNAKYWFRRAGVHPIHPELGKRAMEFARSAPKTSRLSVGSWRRLCDEWERQMWNPYLFVDEVEAVVEGGADADTVTLMERIQRLEIALLIRYTFRQWSGQDVAIPL